MNTVSEENHLRVEFLRGGEVREFTSALSSFENAYNHLYALDLIIDQAKKDLEKRYPWAGRLQSSGDFPPSNRPIKRIRKVNEVILPGDRLRIARIRIESPGFVELLGSLNPLETIRQYLQDRHERRKDHKYREKAEAEKLALENEVLKNEVIRGRMQVLREMGVSEEKVRQAILEHFFEPVATLDGLQDSNLIGGAYLLPAGPSRGPDER